MKKRILSLLMSLCLIVMFLPVATYAAEEGPEAAIGETNYGTLQEAIDGAQDGDTIRVLRDISLTKDTPVTIAPDTPKEITIDLNQKTISYPNDGEWDMSALTISKPITLNIKNGKIDVGDEDHTAIKITCAEETPVDLTLSGVTIQAGYAAIYTDIGNAAGKNRIMLENVDITSDEYGVNASDADITFKSGSIHTTNDETFYLSRCSLTIDDGEFITTDDTCMDLWDEDTVVINGGYFKSGDDNALYLGSDSKATLNGGIFEAPDKAIDADAENVTLGENLKTVLQDGTTLEDFLNSTYVSVVKTTATVTFISDEQIVAEVLVRKGQSISGDDLADQSMPADPTKDRYIFKGWWTGENGTGEAFTDTSIVTNDLTVYAKMDEVGGSLTISKTVNGTGTPDADTLFEFTVTKDKTAAVGQYSVDGGTVQTIPADGKISLKAGQSAVLTDLEPGEYTVTETSPTQANYKSTTFSVNNGEVQNGLSATVTVTGAAASASVAFTDTYENNGSGGGSDDKGADYTKVDAAIAKANALNKDNYKDFSGVETAVKAVVRGKNITEQSEVDAMAKAIEDAIAALQYKDADYTKVDAAIAKANALNKNDYKDFSGVEAAVKAVVRGKNITEQSEVDKMAKAIEDAIAALEKKPASTKPGTSDKSPQTGDTSNLALWIALLFVSGGAAIGTTVVSRKKKYNR